MNFKQKLAEALGISEDEILVNEEQVRAFVTRPKTHSKNTAGIRMLTDTFVSKAQEKGITLYYDNEYKVDADIFNWLPDAVIVEGPIPPTSITPLPKEGMTEGVMLQTALQLPLSQAIQRMTEELTNGYFDEKNKVLIIYLTDTKDGVPLELIGFRRGDGKLSLSVRRVCTDYQWDLDGGQIGFVSRNKDLKVS